MAPHHQDWCQDSGGQCLQFCVRGTHEICQCCHWGCDILAIMGRAVFVVPMSCPPPWSHDDCILKNVQQLNLTLFPSLILHIPPLSLNNLRPPWMAHALQIGPFILFHFIHPLTSHLTTSGTWKGINWEGSTQGNWALACLLPLSPTQTTLRSLPQASGTFFMLETNLGFKVRLAEPY